jgi:hypothetical protein
MFVVIAYLKIRETFPYAYGNFSSQHEAAMWVVDNLRPDVLTAIIEISPAEDFVELSSLIP